MIAIYSLLLLFFACVGDGVKVRVLVPKFVRDHSAVTLVCQYELGGKPLYAVKWYRGNHEFFRYVPQAKPSMVAFPLPGLIVDLLGSSAHQVTLLDVPVSMSGVVTCEVSTDLTFSTATDSANLTVLGKYAIESNNVRKPLLYLSSTVLKPGSELNINCSAQVTEPPPVISFYIDNRKVDPNVVRWLAPGLMGISISTVEGNDGVPNFQKSKTSRLDHYEEEPKSNSRLDRNGRENGDLYYSPIWIRCEAVVNGIYSHSSTSVPIIPEFRPAEPPEEEPEIPEFPKFDEPQSSSQWKPSCLTFVLFFSTIIIYLA